MKPERCRELLQSTGIARAKMFLKAHLEWLDGAPYAQSPGQIHWRTRPQIGSPRGTRLIVDREQLRKTEAALTKLVHQFPRALPKLVGDVADWAAMVSAMLARLKGAIHGATNLVTEGSVPVETLSRTERTLFDQLNREPALKPLLHCIIWSGWYAPATRQFLLKWIQAQSHWIPDHLHYVEADSGLASLLVAGDLAQADGDDFQSLLDVTLAQASCFQTVTTGLSNEVRWLGGRLRDWRNSKAAAPAIRQSTVAPFGVRVVQFVNWLATQDRPVRQRATRLANLILSGPLVRQWDAGWRKYRLLARQGIRELYGKARHLQGVNFHSEACRISYELEDQIPDEPLCYPLTEVLGHVKTIATGQDSRLNQHLSAVLAAIPVEHSDGRFDDDGLALRLGLLSEAIKPRTTQPVIRYYELLRKYLNSGRDPARLRPWSGVIQSWRGQTCSWSSPRTSVFCELTRQSQWPAYFELLRRAATDASYSFRLNNELTWLLAASDSVDQAYARFQKLAPGGLLADCNQAQIHGAIELESNQFPLAEALSLIGPESRIECYQVPSLLKLHRSFVESGWTDLVPTLLQKGLGTELIRTATQFEVANSSEGLTVPRRPVSAMVPDWVVAFPEPLQATIATFLVLFPDARPRIQRILNKHFPDPGALRAEIAVLRQLDRGESHGEISTAVKHGSVPLAIKRQRRLANLIRRLECPEAVTETAVARLNRELDQALLLEVFRTTNDQIASRVIALLAGRTGLRKFAYHKLPPSHMELVRGILDLKDPYRDYGLRLLRQEWGGMAWDLLEEPANARFRQGLMARGIRLQPWLEQRSRHIPTADGQPEFTLAFESRPVEKLLMGYYFGTCLSPGDCNFYSAIVNAIDINKRVVYGRDAKGEVIGRCLFAIGDADTIMVFRPYSHDGQFQFEKHVTQFASELAAEMGTVVSHTDHVSPVMTPAWYDDGAYNLGNSIASDDSPVRQVLRDATEEILVDSLNAALNPRVLTKSMLELIIELPEFQTSPQLIKPLIPLIQNWESQLASTTIVTAARLADQIGLTEVAARWLGRYAPDWLCRQLRGYLYSDALETVRVLIKYHPSLALRALRNSRSSGEHCDRDESDDFRRQLLAECFDALARPRQAAEMRSTALKPRRVGATI